jgi:DNA-binding response OmpR family regulator
MTVELDLAAAQLRVDGRAVPLPALQRRILHLLMRRPGEVVNTRRLVQLLWPDQDERRARIRLRTQIYRIRRRLRSHACSPGVAIRSVRGEGYVVDVPLPVADTPTNRSASPPNGLHRGEYGVRLLSVSGVQLDLDALQLRCGQRRTDLTVAEFRLFWALMENAGRIIAARPLTDAVWGTDPVHKTRILHEYVGRARRRLQMVGADETLLRTVRHAGYVFDRIGPALAATVAEHGDADRPHRTGTFADIHR